MKQLLLFPFLFLNSLLIYSQAPTIQWQKCFGGTGYEIAYSIQQTSDGGCITTGISYSIDGDITGSHSGGFGDYWVVKFDNSGNIQWQKSLGGTGEDEGCSIRETADGGYIVAGFSTSNDGDLTGNNNSANNWIYWIVKLDNSGTIQWQRSLEEIVGPFSYSIQQTIDGGYIVAGSSKGIYGNNDYLIIKFDNSGAIRWRKYLGGTGYDQAYFIQQTADGGYAVAGSSDSNNGDVTGNHGVYDYWIVKLDTSGTIQWQKSLGGTGDEQAKSIQQTTDGGYIVAGYSKSTNGDVTGNHGGVDYWVVKLDSLGTLQWQKSLGGTFTEYANSIQQTTEGGYIVAGYSTSNNDGDVTGNHGYSDYWVVKLDSSGSIQWQKSLGGIGQGYGYAVQQTIDGGYVVAGGTESTDGDVTGNHGLYDYWIVKLNPTLVGVPVGIEEKSDTNSITISPNPGTGQFYFNGLEKENKIEVYDLTGRLIFQTISQNNNCTIDLSNKDNGIYFYKVIGDNVVSGKLIKQ